MTTSEASAISKTSPSRNGTLGRTSAGRASTTRGCMTTDTATWSLETGRQPIGEVDVDRAFVLADSERCRRRKRKGDRRAEHRLGVGMRPARERPGRAVKRDLDVACARDRAACRAPVEGSLFQAPASRSRSASRASQPAFIAASRRCNHSAAPSSAPRRASSSRTPLIRTTFAR